MASAVIKFSVAAIISSILALAQSNTPLRLETTIALPGVQGRIDHMFFDAKSNRLFVAALGNNTVEVIDIRKGQRLHTIAGMHEPQGIVYEPGQNRLYVANGEDGTLRVFDGTTYQPITSLKLGEDADNVRRDLASNELYVGFGSGALAAFNDKGVKVANISLDAHPESFQLEAHGSRIFVNLPDSHKIAVIDRKSKSVLTSWTTGGASENFPMALDELNHRLFIACRRPAVLVILDTDGGKVISKLPIAGDCDDLFYDAATKRIYATGGEGKVSILQQQDADHYLQMASVATRKGARTSLFSPDTASLFVAARAQGNSAAAIYVYRVQP